MDTYNDFLSRHTPWKFDELTAKYFELHVRQSIPLYDELHAMVVDLSNFFINTGSTIVDIGTSTGQAILNLSKSHPNKNLNFFGIDSSLPMLAKAKKRLSSTANVNLIHANIAEFKFPISDFIISLYTMQFIEVTDRATVIKNIFDSLVTGGGFVMAEKIIINTPIIDSIFVKCYNKLKIKNGLPFSHIKAKSKSLQGIMKPLSLDENLTILSETGFRNITTFFQCYNFAGILAIK